MMTLAFWQLAVLLIALFILGWKISIFFFKIGMAVSVSRGELFICNKNTGEWMPYNPKGEEAKHDKK